MNLKNLHTENKAVQTNVIFTSIEGKVISLQIAAGEQLKEHITKIPALLICVSGKAVFYDENDNSINLESGEYVYIEADVKHWVDAIEESNFILIK
jgi:quercetin dioxygenase-like cupin family protein